MARQAFVEKRILSEMLNLYRRLCREIMHPNAKVAFAIRRCKALAAWEPAQAAPNP